MRGTVLACPLMTRPVVPSSEIQSPSFSTLPCDAHLAVLLADLDVARACHAALAHAARDHSGVAGHAAARGENAGRDLHAVNVFRRGFAAHQDQLGFLSF